MRYGFGVDIFGDQTKIGCFDETGRLVEKWEFPTPVKQGSNEILPTVADQIDHYISTHQLFEDDIIGIGVGIPGPVNSAGTVNKCVNFGWGTFNICHALSGLTGLPVTAGNVATLAALGECWKGKGARNMVYMSMNTGLGGAIVCDGNVIHGYQGGAGEFGHIIVNREETEPCTCGRRGCAEQYCSPVGILRLTRRHLAMNSRPSVLRRRTPASYLDVVQAAQLGDKLAVDIMDQFYEYAGRLLSHICCVTNPEVVVLGGAFIQIGPGAIEKLGRHFRNYIFPANENVRFEFSRLGNDACIYGAFKQVLDKFT